MADDTRAQIQIGADTTALEAGVERAKRSLSDLGATADKAGKQTSDGFSGANKELDRGGLSAKAYANALRQVGPQVTDIFTGLASGQKPFTVLIQQGGQLKDVFGGIGPAARALSGYVLGLINPLTVAAGAAAGLIYAFHAGQAESAAYAKALILSGNAAGTTASNLQAMAANIARASGATQGAAAEAVAQVAQTGDIAAQNLEKVSGAALAFERATGTAVKNTVAQFVELGRAPLEASVKLNDSFHYLTLSVYQQIRALEQAGKTTEAATLAQSAYADALQSRSGQVLASLGSIERAWLAIKTATNGAIDAALNIGRTNTTAQSLVAAQAELSRRQQRGPLNPLTEGSFEKGNQSLRETIALLSKRLLLEDNVAVSAKSAADQVQARSRFDKEGEEFLDKKAKQEREITKARNEGLAAGASQAEIEKRIADIREKFKDEKAIRTGLAIDRSQLRADLEAYKAASEQFVNTTKNQERVLDAQHSAGLIGDQDYYQKKRDLLVEQNAVAEFYLEQEIKRAQKEQKTLTGKDAIDNQTKIIDLRKSLNELQANSTASLAILAAQQQASASKLAVSFLAARQSAQEFFDVLERQQGRDLTFGQGNASRDFNAGINQISDRFNDQRRRLQDQREQQQLAQNGQLTDEQRRSFDEQLSIISEFQAKSTASFKDYYDKRQKQEASADLGMQEAVKNYLDEISKTGKATQEAVGQSLHTLEDELTNLLTGKGFDAKRLVDQIISEFLRLQVIRPIMQQALGGGGGSGGWLNLLLSAFSGSSGGGGFGTGSNYGNQDYGAYLASGTNYVPNDGFKAVLHEGEAVIPKAYNPSAGGTMGGGITINPVYHIGEGVNRAEVVQAVAAGNAKLKADLMRARNHGTGVFA